LTSSCRSARRSISTAAVGLIAIALLPSCGSNTNAVADPTTTSQSASTSGELRLGCGTFCQNAGGYGGGLTAVPEIPAATVVSNGTVTPAADGYLPVTVECDLPVQCSGALSLDLKPFGMSSPQLPTTVGRSDLLLDGGATRTFGLLLPPEALAYLKSHGPTPTWVVADSRQVHPCPQIPQLAARCAHIAQANGFGDGIDRVAGRQLTVAPPR